MNISHSPSLSPSLFSPVARETSIFTPPVFLPLILRWGGGLVKVSVIFTIGLTKIRWGYHEILNVTCYTNFTYSLNIFKICLNESHCRFVAFIQVWIEFREWDKIFTVILIHPLSDVAFNTTYRPYVYHRWKRRSNYEPPKYNDFFSKTLCELASTFTTPHITDSYRIVGSYV